jgi:hypothetical protein
LTKRSQEQTSRNFTKKKLEGFINIEEAHKKKSKKSFKHSLLVSNQDYSGKKRAVDKKNAESDTDQAGLIADKQIKSLKINNFEKAI